MTSLYDIGPFRLDAEAGVLTNAGTPMALGPRAVAVLTALVRRANEYVQKRSLMEAAWPGVVVEESNLAVQISSIRHVLAQAPGGEHWIETLAKRGYRFVGPVAPLADDRQEAGDGRKRTNLQEPLTSFIGRERELVEIKRLLPDNRLLTLVGMGGIGKTRLALQAGAEVVDAYRDGVWFVDLAPLTDPLLVPSAVAQVLGVREVAGKPITAELCRQCKGRQLLLLLDNCEHLLNAAAGLLEALLGTVPEMTIIATSREPLRIAGEQTYPLQTLSLPNPSAHVEIVGRSEAVQLFVERARQQQPGFELTAALAPVVAGLCIHLDGIPLALELAAARVRSLSIEQINARLDDRFRLLTGGGRTALPRQQTLRATFDWSHDLLAEQERVVLRRLAVFPSGFTLEAAAAIAADAAIDERAVTDLLAHLVARSMILADTSGTEARYRLLETTRAYALENLAECGEVDVVKRRHAQYFCERFEGTRDDGRHPSEAWRNIHEPELDDMRAALDWTLDPRGDPAIGVALAGVSHWLWSALSLLGEGRRRVEAAGAKVDAGMPLSDRARLWLALGTLRNVSDPVAATAALEHAVELYRQLDDPLGLGMSLVELGRIRVFMGRFEPAAGAFGEAFPLLKRAGGPKDLAFYFESAGFLKMLAGDFAGARATFEKALSLYRELQAEVRVLAILINIADMTWALGDLDAALNRFREAAARMRQLPHFTKKDMLGVCLTNLAGVHTERGELSEALAAAREGLPLRRELNALSTLDHLALRAVLAGKGATGARLAGYTDHASSARQSRRQPNEARARERLQTLLVDAFALDELERLLAEGATMTEGEAIRLALED